MSILRGGSRTGDGVFGLDKVSMGGVSFLMLI